MQRMLTGCALAAAAAGAAVSIASCQQAATNVTTRALELPQKVDVACLQVNPLDGGAALAAPVPVPANVCQPVAATNTNPTALPYHLYAVVTQLRRGALGVIDLTAGAVVDVDKSNPGTDFIPVGANPTDVVVTPDGAFTYASSADPGRFAVYRIDNTRLLGDSTGTSAAPAPPPLRLPDIPSCGLPQAPEALAVLPAAAADGGSGGASPAGGSFVLVAALRGTAGSPADPGGAAVVTIDPGSLSPGSLQPCAIVGATLLTSGGGPPPPPGPPWPDGIPYADAGPTPVPALGPDSSCAGSDGGAAAADAGGSSAAQNAGDGEAPPMLPPAPAHPASAVLRNDVPVLYVADSALPLIHVIDLHDPAHPTELEPLVASSVVEPARAVTVGQIAISPPTRDYRTYLYAVDARQGTLMVYDVTDPVASPHVPLLRPHDELTPLSQPDRIAFAGSVVSVGFAQHDWPLPLAADPTHAYTGLLCNPNPDAYNPSTNTFNDLGAYYRADQVTVIQATDTQGGTVQTLPTRLRGVFGFATLSNGNVVTIDVDDWDAPCRRPDPMADGSLTGVLDFPQPAMATPDDMLPQYQAPFTYDGIETAAVTLEAFFPVSAPHRPRSANLLRNDPTSGAHIPYLLTIPQLFNANGATVGASGNAGLSTPLMLPTPLPPGFIDPSYLTNPAEPNPQNRTYSSQALAGVTGASLAERQAAVFPGGAATPSVRVSFDDPTAHLDQDWTVAYEGALPTVSGIAADLVSNDGYSTLLVTRKGARFCADGIEDWTIGQARAGAMLDALASPGVQLPAPPGFDSGLTPAPTLPQWTSDYVEIADDLLANTDAYWATPSTAVSPDCWGEIGLDDDGGTVSTAGGVPRSSRAQDRYNFCLNTFGTAATADTELLRDLPIVHAFDDALQVTTFSGPLTDPSSGVTIPEQTTNRVIRPPDPSNSKLLQAVQCCFHRQATFKVRAGGEWVTSGSSVGFLHHVTAASSGSADTGPACVLSCDPRLALMNGRSFDVPWSTFDQRCAPPASLSPTNSPTQSAPFIDRDSPLAMRNPMFSFILWSGCGPRPAFGDHTLSTRDLTWRFSLRGSFSPLTTSIVTQGASNAVSPQSMRFIAPLGQMAVVDGEAQGLVLIDLNLMSISHTFQ